MSRKHIKLNSEASPAADEVWAAAKPIAVHPDGGSSHATIPESHLLVTTTDGKKKKIAVRITKEEDLLLEFDA